MTYFCNNRFVYIIYGWDYIEGKFLYAFGVNPSPPCETAYFMYAPSHTEQQQKMHVYLIIIYTLWLN